MPVLNLTACKRPTKHQQKEAKSKNKDRGRYQNGTIEWLSCQLPTSLPKPPCFKTPHRGAPCSSQHDEMVFCAVVCPVPPLLFAPCPPHSSALASSVNKSFLSDRSFLLLMFSFPPLSAFLGFLLPGACLASKLLAFPLCLHSVFGSTNRHPFQLSRPTKLSLDLYSVLLIPFRA